MPPGSAIIIIFISKDTKTRIQKSFSWVAQEEEKASQGGGLRVVLPLELARISFCIKI